MGVGGSSSRRAKTELFWTELAVAQDIAKQLKIVSDVSASAGDALAWVSAHLLAGTSAESQTELPALKGGGRKPVIWMPILAVKLPIWLSMLSKA